jgi:hypothetical protein
VIRWVSTPMRSIRSPPARSCSHSGLSHCGVAIAAEDVVDENVEPPVFVVDPSYERLHLFWIEMVDSHCHTVAAGDPDQVTGLFDRLRAVDLGTSFGPAAPPRRVDVPARST